MRPTLAAVDSIRNELVNLAIEHIPFGVCMFDADDRLILANTRFKEIYRHPEVLVQPGTPFSAIIAATRGTEVKERDLDATGAERPLHNHPDEHVIVREWRLEDGRFVEITVARIGDGSCVALHEDVTEQRRRLDRIVYLSRHDPLTGLLNRDRFIGELEIRLEGAREQMAVLVIDLDRFKSVNDRLGHAAGDDLIKQVADRLRTTLGQTARLGRLGGDEFAALVSDPADIGDGIALADEIIRTLGMPYMLSAVPITIGASVGLALTGPVVETADQLLKKADLAMYRAKREGRNRSRQFQPYMQVAASHRQRLENDLREALPRGELALHYQPIFAAKNRTLAGFETLLRWNHPNLGRVSPCDFIPIAEETGSIIAIGEWVLQQACQDAMHWPSHLRVAVNVSPVQFKSELLGLNIVQALHGSGLAASRLDLEITEGVLLDDTDRTLNLLKQINELGASISMDDFGTGYSSLAYLTKFPFASLKIDGSFVRNALEDKNALTVVKTVVALGSGLGIKTVAEGVETEQQLDMISAIGCDEVQGFLLGRPADFAASLITAGTEHTSMSSFV